MKKNLFRGAVYALLLPLLVSCSDDSDFTPIQSGPFKLVSHTLEGVKVNELILKGDMIFAATEDGVYGRQVNSPDIRFITMGLKGKNIRDIHPFTVSEILASEVTFSSEGNQTQLYRTGNAGTDWEEYETNFGDSLADADGLGDFEPVPSQPNHLYASGNRVVAKSTDKGKTWEPVWGEWGMAGTADMILKVNPKKPDEFWAGGQGNIENGFLVRVTGNEETGYWDDLVPNPTVVKELVFDRENPQTMYVGWEGALTKTVDNGTTWTTLIDRVETKDFYFGIGISTQDPNIVFAGKWLKGGVSQPLEISYSKDKGETWESHSFPHITNGGILDLKVIRQGNLDRIFVGLDKGGIVELQFELDQ